MEDNVLEGLDDATREEVERLTKITRKSDSDENFALAKRRLAEIYYNHGFFDKSLKMSELIRLQDSEELYEKSQYSIAAAYGRQGKIEQALEIWSKVKDSFPDIYAKAQYSIGLVLSSEGKTREAKIAWNNVKKDANREAYAKA